MSDHEFAEIDEIAAAAEARVLSTSTELDAEEREIDEMVMERLNERFNLPATSSSKCGTAAFRAPEPSSEEPAVRARTAVPSASRERPRENDELPQENGHFPRPPPLVRQVAYYAGREHGHFPVPDALPVPAKRRPH